MLIFLGCAIGGALLLSRARQWLMMTDELLYVEIARGIAGSGLPWPTARGEPVAVYQLLYPLVISPIVGLVDMPGAYGVITAFNAVLMASAVFPAYLLTNFVTANRTAARWVAACTGVAPWLAMGSKILTDALAYPVFIWAIYAIVLAVASPGRRRDAWAVAAVVAAFLTRSHFIVLLPVFVGAILLRCWIAAITAPAPNHARRLKALPPATRVELRRRWPVIALFVVVSMLIVVAPRWILGIYGTTADGTQGGVLTPNLLRASLAHLGILAVGIGPLAIALALPWLGAGLGRTGDERQHAGAVVMVVAIVAMLLTAASFDQRFTFAGEIFERYVFYIVPLLLCATAAGLARPVKHWAAWALPVLAGVLVIASDERFGLDIPTTIRFSMSFKPASIFMIELQKIVDGVGLPNITIALAILAVIGAVVAWWLIAGQHLTAALNAIMGVTLAFTLACTLYVVPKAIDAQNSAGYLEFVARDAKRDWLDRAAGTASVALVEGSINEQRSEPIIPSYNQPTSWWDLELWNDSIGTYYTPRAATLDGTLPTMEPYYKLGLDFESGVLDTAGGRDDSWLVMSASDPRFAPFSFRPPVHGGPLAAYETGPDPRASWMSRGLSAHGLLARDAEATIRVFSTPQPSRAATGLLALRVEASPLVKNLPNPFTKRARERSVGPVREIVTRLCIPARGHTDVRFSGSELADRAGVNLQKATPRVISLRVDRSAGNCTR